eukprot:scaffold131_cov174-Ochromonas_danica.AAC.5
MEYDYDEIDTIDRWWIMSEASVNIDTLLSTSNEFDDGLRVRQLKHCEEELKSKWSRLKDRSPITSKARAQLFLLCSTPNLYNNALVNLDEADKVRGQMNPTNGLS